jgi:hypothetical protein
VVAATPWRERCVVTSTAIFCLLPLLDLDYESTIKIH